MKKCILISMAIFAFSFANAQGSKGYIGVSIGASFPLGDLKGYSYEDSYTGGPTFSFKAKTGLNLGLINAGYRFTETYGVTFNWGSTAYSGTATEDAGTNYYEEEDYTIGIGYIAIGPMFSFPLTNKIGLDLKPQIAFTSGTIDYSDNYFDDVNFDSSIGFILGSSLNYPIAEHWGLALNLDYLTTKFKEADGEELDSDYAANAFSTSLGIQYKF